MSGVVDNWPYGLPKQEDGPFSSSLIGRWPMITGSGTLEPDIIQRNVGDILNECEWNVTSEFTPALQFKGGSNSYINLGSTLRLLSSTEPFTATWWEYVESGYGTFPTVACIQPTGVNRFTFLRSSSATYQHFSCGALQGAGRAMVFSGAPSLASSVDMWRFWALSGEGGMGSTTSSDYSLFVDGQTYAVTSTPAYGTFAVAQNYIGWDGADDRFNGFLRDFRLYNRVLEDDEKHALMIDRSSDLVIPQNLYALMDGVTVRHLINGGLLNNGLVNSGLAR